MEIILAAEFEKTYSCLPKQIQLKAEKQTEIFKNNPLYPSLHTEKLIPKSRAVWSFRIDRKYRIIFRFVGNGNVEFLTVGPHDWVYKINFK
jgi:plasmid maintenance system killer protein